PPAVRSLVPTAWPMRRRRSSRQWPKRPSPRYERRRAVPRRELLPLRGQRSGTSRKRGGTPMSIIIDKHTKVITQGITGKTGAFHTRMCRDYANGRECFVAGVNPNKAGANFEGIPIFGTVK